MKQKNVMAGVALDNKTKSNLSLMAKHKKTSLSRLFKNAVAFYLLFDDEFLGMAQKMAGDLGLSTSFVIERLSLVTLAEMAADEGTAGEPIQRLLVEFTPGLSAQQFFDSWKNNKIEQLKRQRRVVNNPNLPPAKWE